MAVYIWYKRDKKVCYSYRKSELNKLVLKSLLSNFNFSWGSKYYWSKHFHRYGKLSSISAHRRYCLVSKGGRSIFRTFKMSRHSSKHYASKGALIGMRKSSF